MHLTIDTKAETLDEVLRVIGAAYDVALTPVGAETPTRRTVAARSDRAAARTAKSTATKPTTPKAPRKSAGRRSTNGRRRAGSGTGTAPAQIREWAAANGYEVSSRGALPRAVSEAFAASQG